MPVLLENNVTHPHLFRHTTRLMGNRFEFTVVAETSQKAEAGISLAIDEVKRLERLLTTFDDNSQTAAVNRMAGIEPVQVSREFYELVARCQKISNLTQGAFDITYGSADKRFWNFDTTLTSLPDPETARQAVRLINYRNVVLNEQDCTVFLKEKGMRLGFGGIGKGYAAGRARLLLENAGYTGGIINAAGDLTAWGLQPDGHPWKIGIADPEIKDLPFSSVSVSGMAVATSGDYEKYALIGGKRYSHTIDPRSGLPVTGIKSVTIICPHAELADALATPVMIMGKEAGLHLVNQLEKVACLVITDDNKLHLSDNIHAL